MGGRRGDVALGFCASWRGRLGLFVSLALAATLVTTEGGVPGDARGAYPRHAERHADISKCKTRISAARVRVCRSGH